MSFIMCFLVPWASGLLNHPFFQGLWVASNNLYVWQLTLERPIYLCLGTFLHWRFVFSMQSVKLTRCNFMKSVTWFGWYTGFGHNDIILNIYWWFLGSRMYICHTSLTVNLFSSEKLKLYVQSLKYKKRQLTHDKNVCDSDRQLSCYL